MFRSLTKTIVVVVSSTVLVTLSTNAIDMRGNFSRTFLGSVVSSIPFFTTSTGACPEHMVLVTQAVTPFCIDMYEASPSTECTYDIPETEEESLQNLANPECHAVANPNTVPWRFVSLTQAQLACSRAGKRLPTASEWYKSAIGTPDSETGLSEEHCNIAGNRADGVGRTGEGMRCVSDAGAYDMVGNVWEWVDETVAYGMWHERMLPVTGFVKGVDRDGIAFETGTAKDVQFMDDRIWTDATIVAGMMRGGYYNSGSHAGVFSAYIASPPTFSGNALGFRCVVSVM